MRIGKDKKVKPGSPAYYAHLDYQTWNLLQKAVRFVLRFFWHLFARIEIEGIHNVPLSGGLILMCNHISLLDVPIFMAFTPRRMVTIALERWRKWPIIGCFLNTICNAIYVSRGGINVEPLKCALSVLRMGGCVLITPEGTISKSRTLMKGNSGVSFLANRTGMPILPWAVYGQDKVLQYWIRLRRAPIYMRFGEITHLPQERASSAQLETYTLHVMNCLNNMLPPEYRNKNT